MVIETDSEILRLRAVVRDLVALSTIPVAWIGREPPAVAAGLADTLIALLQVDFVAVRFCDPDGAGGVDEVRGNSWKTFPQWLERHLAMSGRLAGTEIIPDVGGGGNSCRGVVIPIGVNAEGGVVAAACDRVDFPTEFDQLLLSLAANHAATAFQSARLLHERVRAEEELRKARNELEVKVAERTAELRRSEGYLAEAQRLAHIGSFALSVPDGVPTHSSDEHSRLYGFDPAQEVPSLQEFLQRIHPDDRENYTQALERGIRDAASFETEYRIVLPRSPLKHIRARAHPVFSASGGLEEFVGTVIDVTDRKSAEEERQAQLWFFETMDRINRAMQSTGDLERMMGDVLDVVLMVFRCDRAWLIYPCDPEVASHRVRMERTRPESLGAFRLGAEIPNDPEVASMFRSVAASSGPVRFDPESGNAVPTAPAERFSIRSMIAMAVHPKVDKPYMFGLHQCDYPRVWTPQEQRLFQEVGRRLADALDTLVMFRDLREAHHMLEASRDELRALADEQAALRRVATLVASGVPPEEVFALVSEELRRLLPIDFAVMGRYGADGAVIVVAACGTPVARFPLGSRWGLAGENLAKVVLEKGSPARIEGYAGASGQLGFTAGESGIGSTIATPIMVEGRLWGAIFAGSSLDQSLPVETEARLGSFTELVATAIANAESRAALAASRARTVAAADESRRRIERDLHDGAQQRLVHAVIVLKLALRALANGDTNAGELAAEALRHAEQANFDLRELAHGILPAALTSGGLRAGVEALVSSVSLPVSVEVPAERLPAGVEATAYFVISEALTNVVKHACATRAGVKVRVERGELLVEVRDNGVGGARGDHGTGLSGLEDRVSALDGYMVLESPAGGGTRVCALLPISDQA